MSDSLAEFMAAVHPALKARAKSLLKRERSNHILDVDGLVSEAAIEMAQRSDESWTDEAQVLRAASCEMRRVLVDYARASNTLKRGRGTVRVPCDQALLIPSRKPVSIEMILTIHELIGELAELAPRVATTINLHYFEGYGRSEIAGQLGVSVGTVKADMKAARSWLRTRLGGQANMPKLSSRVPHSETTPVDRPEKSSTNGKLRRRRPQPATTPSVMATVGSAA